MLRRRRDHAPPTPMTLAFAGAGTITVAHGIAAAALGVPVVAVASRTPERARERAGQLGARAVEYDALPAGADAVVVATPPAEHEPLAVAALAAGAAALVETPLAASLDAADRIVEAAARARRPLLYAEQLASSPVVTAARAQVAELGPLDVLELRALQPRPDRGGQTGPGWGGGALFELGSHPLTVLLLLTRPDPVRRLRATLEGPADQGLDDHAVVELELASGARARVEVSWREPDAVWDLQASSATGVVRADLLPDAGLERDGEPLPPPPPDPRSPDPRLDHLGQLEQLRVLGAALDGGAVEADAAFGRDVLELICASYASAGRDGGWVELPFAGRRDRTPLELWLG